jgi:hypothetical protein
MAVRKSLLRIQISDQSTPIKAAQMEALEHLGTSQQLMEVCKTQSTYRRRTGI